MAVYRVDNTEKTEKLTELKWCDHVEIRPAGMVGGQVFIFAPTLDLTVMYIDRGILKFVCGTCFYTRTVVAPHLTKLSPH